MRYFLRKLSFFFVLLFLLFLITVYLIELLIYINTDSERYLLQADWHIKHPLQNDILIIGNSRVFVQIDGKLLSKILGVKCYALAQDGRDSKVLWNKFKVYLNNNQAPDRVVFQLDPSFIPTKSINDNTFYGKNDYISYLFMDRLNINSVFSKELGFEKYDEYFPLVRYVHYPELFDKHLFRRSAPVTDEGFYLDSSLAFGTSPKFWFWNDNPIGQSDWSHPDKISGKISFSYVDSFRIYCKANEIDLKFIYPPQSYISYCRVDSTLIDEMIVYAKKYNLSYKNFNSTKFNDTSLFYNHMHLNHKGASLFTYELGNYLLGN
jgi:hypothetical protein